MSLGVIIEDDVVPMPLTYRGMALARPYTDVQAGIDTFHGVAPADALSIDPWFLDWIRQQGRYETTLSILRQSPADQPEPHYIHHDAMMGDWTAILYLNPEPHPGDGTVFWEHRSGECGPHPGNMHAWSDDVSQFTERFRVKAQFNRAVIFPSKWFHSRALFENYGTGDDARLIQVAFGKVN